MAESGGRKESVNAQPRLQASRAQLCCRLGSACRRTSLAITVPKAGFQLPTDRPTVCLTPCPTLKGIVCSCTFPLDCALSLLARGEIRHALTDMQLSEVCMIFIEDPRFSHKMEAEFKPWREKESNTFGVHGLPARLSRGNTVSDWHLLPVIWARRD